MRRRMDFDRVVLGVCVLFIFTLACSLGGNTEPTEQPRAQPTDIRPVVVQPTQIPPAQPNSKEPSTVPTQEVSDP